MSGAVLVFVGPLFVRIMRPFRVFDLCTCAMTFSGPHLFVAFVVVYLVFYYMYCVLFIRGSIVVFVLFFVSFVCVFQVHGQRSSGHG